MHSRKLIQIAAFSYPHEAHIAKASLEAANIPAVIVDEHTINMQWLYSNAIGGVKLLVEEAYAEEASALIADDFSENVYQETQTESPKCASCGGTNIEAHTIGKKPAFIVFLLLGFPLFFYKHATRCRDCGRITKL